MNDLNPFDPWVARMVDALRANLKLVTRDRLRELLIEGLPEGGLTPTVTEQFDALLDMAEAPPVMRH